MRIWLDDVRDPSFSGWSGDDIVVCRTATEAIGQLRTGLVKGISLDHDLGGWMKDAGEDGLSGYDVACWIERAVAEGSLREVPRWEVHSNNPSGALRIRAAMESAERLRVAREEAPMAINPHWAEVLADETAGSSMLTIGMIEQVAKRLGFRGSPEELGALVDAVVAIGRWTRGVHVESDDGGPEPYFTVEPDGTLIVEGEITELVPGEGYGAGFDLLVDGAPRWWGFPFWSSVDVRPDPKAERVKAAVRDLLALPREGMTEAELEAEIRAIVARIAST